MKTIVRSALLVATALACTALAAPADAASNRTFVSGLGADSNPCTLTAPCRTLQAAFNATANNGEIEVLDPTGYGSLTITHGISIQGHGWASMNGGGNATIIIAAGGGDHVSLRGLIIEGFGVQGTGVEIDTAGIVNIQDTVVRNFTSSGINFPSTIESTLVIVNSIISDNFSGLNVLTFRPEGSPSIFVDLNGVSFVSNGSGMEINSAAIIAVKNCMVVGSGGDGVDIISGSVRISDSLIANNGGVGVSQQNGSGTLERTHLVGNHSDWSGNVTSYGNNVMDQAGPPLVALK